MKALVSTIALAAAFVWTAPAPSADAASRSYRAKHAKKYYRTPYAYRSYQRPQSIGPNGLCQRDTGTPTSQLNFRNRCDTEEFWERQRRGGFGRGF